VSAFGWRNFRTVNTLRTGDEFSRLWRLFFTTLKDRWRKFAFLHARGFYALNYTINKATKKMVAERG
jgi:hypothetical protein